MRTSLAEIVLFIRALPVVRAAQAVRTEPLTEVIANVSRYSAKIGRPEPARVVQAAKRACARYHRWFGGLDSCLTRSLVAGAILAWNHEVVLHVGFRPTDRGAAAVDGHAWLVVDGEVMELTGIDRGREAPYQSTLGFPMG